MFLEIYDGELSARSLQLLAGLGLGLIFGIAAQISRFCLRRGLASDDGPDYSALAVWITAFAVGVIGYQSAAAFGLVDLSAHRFGSTSISPLAIAIGGVMFGAGMVLTRGCISRLTVLTGSGNLRAATVLVLFAITAHATIKGVLAPLRVWIGGFETTLPFNSLANTPATGALAAILFAAIAAVAVKRSNARTRDVLLGGVIGLVAIAGWMATSTALFDEFEPLPVQSAAFTLPWSDSLFWVVAATSIPAGFGVGWVGGVLAGSFGSAALRGELQLQSFETPQQTLRYVSGALLMGVGGVLAGGCTIGAGLSGGASLSIAALMALAAIAAGALGTRAVLNTGLHTQRRVLAR